MVEQPQPQQEMELVMEGKGVEFLDEGIVRELRNLMAAIVWLLLMREIVRIRFQRQNTR